MHERVWRGLAVVAVGGVLLTPSLPAGAGTAFHGAGPHPMRDVALPVPLSADGVLVAAGDIACDPGSSAFAGGAGTASWCRARDTLAVVQGIDPDVVLPLGDEQYDDGSLAKFRRSYDLSWGKVRARSRPAPGNHEYGVPKAEGYFRYFGSLAGTAGRGWYSYDLAGWHLVALNSNCDRVGCRVGSPQYRWLAADLRANPAACTLAYFHHPRFSSGPHGDDPEAAWTRDLWRLMYAQGIDVILNGHDHIYERFAPQDDKGKLDAEHGIREFIAGTGGGGVYKIGKIAPNSEVHDNSAYGVLKLTLAPGRYSWEFVPIPGARFRDEGAGSCVAPR